MHRTEHIPGYIPLGLLMALFSVSACSSESSSQNAATGCPTGWVICNGICIDISTNQSHCGGCDMPCPQGLCTGGVCYPSGVGGQGPSGISGIGTSGQGSMVVTSGTSSISTAGMGSAGSSGASSIGNSAGTTAGTTGSIPTSGTGSAASVEGGGYITSGNWKGYAWTWAENGATITPEDFSATTDFPLCASGTVAADDAYSSLAIVGWSINQDSGDGDPKLEVTPGADGITIAVSNPGASELRLQIQGKNGPTDPNDRWCAIIPGNGDFIPYEGFNTECWVGGDGVAYNGEPFVEVMVLIPALATTDVPFDFCINSLEETNQDGSSTASTGCSLGNDPGERDYQLTNFDTALVTRQGQQYVVQNNVWANDGSLQTITGTGVAFEVTQQGNNASGNVPSSYPSVFIGSNHGHSTSQSNLPIQVSQIQSVETGWRWSGGSGGKYNSAYDVWFSSNAGGDSGNPSGAYLMVWFDDNNASVMPMGSQSGTVSIAGKAWNRWTCPGACQNQVPVISYVLASGSMAEWSFDLKSFIDDAVAQGVVQDSWYLTNIFAGFEIWNGGVGLKTEDFCAVVN